MTSGGTRTTSFGPWWNRHTVLWSVFDPDNNECPQCNHTPTTFSFVGARLEGVTNTAIGPIPPSAVPAVFKRTCSKCGYHWLLAAK